MVAQFYFRLNKTEYDPLLVYLDRFPKTRLKYKCFFEILSYLNYLNVELDFANLPYDWHILLNDAMDNGHNILVKSLINRFTSY